MLEELAAAHDRDIVRLTAWRERTRRWLDSVPQSLQPAERRLRWLRGERRLSRSEMIEHDRLSFWLDGFRAQIAEHERAEMELTAEIAQHRAAAQRLRAQKAASGDADPPAQPSRP